MTAEIVNRFGFELFAPTTRNGAADCHDAQAGLLLTDASMPIMKGVELVITKLLPATKILLFSGQAGVSDIVREGEEKVMYSMSLPNPSIQRN